MGNSKPFADIVYVTITYDQAVLVCFTTPTMSASNGRSKCGEIKDGWSTHELMWDWNLIAILHPKYICISDTRDTEQFESLYTFLRLLGSMYEFKRQRYLSAGSQ